VGHLRDVACPTRLCNSEGGTGGPIGRTTVAACHVAPAYRLCRPRDIRQSLHGARLFRCRATMPHAATPRELPSFVLKGWGASPKKRRSIMMRNIVTGLAAAVIATAASTFSASAIHGGFGGGGFRGGHFGGGFARPAFGGGRFARPAFAGRGRFMGTRAFAFRGNRFAFHHPFFRQRFAFNRFAFHRPFFRHRFASNRFAFRRPFFGQRFASNRFAFHRPFFRHRFAFNRFAFRRPFFRSRYAFYGGAPYAYGYGGSCYRRAWTPWGWRLRWACY
jgi:hypothetical protein